MKGVIVYKKKTKSKIRTITAYSKLEEGINLKKKHNKIKEKLYEIFEEKKTTFTYAYQKDSNTKKMVQKHLNSTYFLKVDIFSFFDSILHEKLISKIGKKLIDKDIRTTVKECSNDKKRGISIGLIPSPILANIYLYEFDKALDRKLTTMGNFIYTRYADDLTISSKEVFNQNTIIEIIKFLLLKDGLYLNTNKIQKVNLLKIGNHIKITGLNIVKGRESNYITVSRKFKKEIKLEANKYSKNAKKGYVLYNEYRNKKQ